MRPAVFLEPAQPADLDALVALERLCFSHPWTPRNFTDAMADPPRSRVVLLRVPHPSGHPERGIAAYCVYEMVAGELHVHNVAVHPGVRRSGLGRLLVAAVMAVAAHAGAHTALLEVRRSNEAARRLYEALGFRLLGARRNYYSHPVEDALVMEKALP
ncbi:MAG TPA: ribosomal protein S18-alanine N-acetyltransferase [Vicinamibacteria bacterium]|nr:ribosomal protein S18-alanine N-acetyltransferase [Vicinamibacteria bacterium]